MLDSDSRRAGAGPVGQTVQARAWRNIVSRPVTPNIPTPVHVFYPLYKPLSRLAQEFVSVLKAPR